jgi:hypothetical protein
MTANMHSPQEGACFIDSQKNDSDGQRVHRDNFRACFSLGRHTDGGGGGALTDTSEEKPLSTLPPQWLLVSGAEGDFSPMINGVYARTGVGSVDESLPLYRHCRSTSTAPGFWLYYDEHCERWMVGDDFQAWGNPCGSQDLAYGCARSRPIQPQVASQSLFSTAPPEQWKVKRLDPETMSETWHASNGLSVVPLFDAAPASDEELPEGCLGVDLPGVALDEKGRPPQEAQHQLHYQIYEEGQLSAAASGMAGAVIRLLGCEKVLDREPPQPDVLSLRVYFSYRMLTLGPEGPEGCAQRSPPSPAAESGLPAAT